MEPIKKSISIPPIGFYESEYMLDVVSIYFQVNRYQPSKYQIRFKDGYIWTVPQKIHDILEKYETPIYMFFKY